MTPDDLLGRWDFERMIDDRVEKRRIPVAGEATFTPRGPGEVVWLETGTMHLPSGPVPISTERLLVRDAVGSWAANFADGRGFHEWTWAGELVHDCAPDLYRGLLEGRGDGWRMRWSASGPAKDYTIETSYRRSVGPSARV